MSASAVAEAERLAKCGLLVFPVLSNKAPATPHGFRDATRDPEAVAALWRRHPGKLVGVVTGEPSGIAVLDLDHRHGGSAWFATHRDRLPKTRVHRTRSRGLHFLFRHHDGLRCSAGRIGPGVDVRAEGGFIIWWPAVGLAVLDDAPLADWPAWLAELALPPAAPLPPEPSPPIRHISKYVEAALRRAAARVGTTREGQRNITLFTEARALRRLPDLAPGEIAATLAYAARRAGLESREIERTLLSALGTGGVA